MTNTNPPKERETTNSSQPSEQNWRCLAALANIADEVFRRHDARRQFGREIKRQERIEAEAEGINLSTWLFLNRQVPDANRRATLWLLGRRWIQDSNDSLDPRDGAREFSSWIRAMCAHSPSTFTIATIVAPAARGAQPDRGGQSLAELLRIADAEFKKQKRIRQFGREIMEALKADEGVELTRHQQLLDELFDPPNRPGWRFYTLPNLFQER
jgi:hypothetical protein